MSRERKDALASARCMKRTFESLRDGASNRKVFSKPEHQCRRQLWPLARVVPTVATERYSRLVPVVLTHCVILIHR